MISSDFRCLSCGSTRPAEFLLQCKDYYMGKAGSFDYYRCETCGLVQLHPVPADMAPYYEMYQVHKPKSRFHELFRKWLMRRVYYNPSTLGRGLRILDFGCGDGWYLREMAREGHQATGFEPNPRHANWLTQSLGIPVFSEIERIESEKKEGFDLVTMHFVVEHLHNLRETFLLAWRLLKPGGRFYFIIPNIESIEARVFKRKWHGFDPPRHILFPTPSVIEKIAEEIGFDIQRKVVFGSPNDLAGTLSTVIFGRFHYLAFCGFLPLALLWCVIGAQGNVAVTLVKKGA